MLGPAAGGPPRRRRRGGGGPGPIWEPGRACARVFICVCARARALECVCARDVGALAVDDEKGACARARTRFGRQDPAMPKCESIRFCFRLFGMPAIVITTMAATMLIQPIDF